MMQRKWCLWLILTTVTITAGRPAPAAAGHRFAAQQLAHERAALREVYAQQRRAAREVFQNELEQVNCARRAALRLCHAARPAALQQVNARRILAVRHYQAELSAAHHQYRIALAELNRWFASARCGRPVGPPGVPPSFESSPPFLRGGWGG